jgi:hypothetical protein
VIGICNTWSELTPCGHWPKVSSEACSRREVPITDILRTFSRCIIPKT